MKESKFLEFKSDKTSTFLKTVSAFANFGAGKIIFGVSDKGENIGVDSPEEFALDIENKINDSIKPKPEYSISINKKSKTVTLNVEEGLFKPYFYKGKAYKRNDTSTVEVDTIELRRLILSSDKLYFEKLSYPDENLTFEALKKELSEKLGIDNVTKDVLKTLGFFESDNKYNNAAALVADVNSFYGVDAVKFGESINEFLDRETYTNISVLEQYHKAIDMFDRYYVYEKIEGTERKKVELIPEDAFREAIANAIIHRSWDVDSHIRVMMFPDRIEIISPGGLPSGISEEEYLKGDVSSLRNPIIGNLFFRLHYIEMFGTGIRRINALYSDFDIKPRFETTPNSVTVVLPVTTYKIKLTTDEKVIYDLLNKGRLLSSSEIAEATGFSKNKVIRQINSMIDKHCIKTEGNGRGTKYSVN